MSADQIIVLTIFVLVFAGILTEILDKTLIVLAAAIIIILSGFLPFDEAIHSIDFNTICLLLGMMLLVDTVRSIRLFEWLTCKLALYTKGDPVLIFFCVGTTTAVFSAFLDNVTTVLIIVPLIIAIARGMGLPPRVYIMSVIFLSNIGGAATLIGDPPNILIGSQVKELTFGAFLQYLTVPVILSCIAAFWYLRATNRDAIKTRANNFSWLFMSNLMLQDVRRREQGLLIPRSVMIRAVLVFALVLVGFFTHSMTHLEPAVVALAGAFLMMIVFHKPTDVHHLLAELEWSTLMFFAGLFVVVGSMEAVGLLELISHTLVSTTDNLLVLLLIVLWASAILSALIDNIPFVAVMIPVLKDLLATGTFSGHPKAGLLWWALALGACFGGNGSMIGASANVVSCAIARSEGIVITFREFLKYSLPVTFMSIVISSGYLTVLYYM